MGIGTVLTIVFLVLKVIGVAQLTWLQVFLPIILFAALYFIYPLVVLLWYKIVAWARSEND